MVRQAVRLDQTSASSMAKPVSLDSLLEQTERRLIELALRRARGHLTRAAESLGIWRQRLKRRMEALGLIPTESPGEDEAE
jgi:DNA-binding NtrC family response regulator